MKKQGNDAIKPETRTASRRKFIGGAAGAAAAGGALLAAPHVARAQTVIKMQTSWPASDIWMDFATQYVDRVEEMSGGRLKIDLLPAGAVVGAFQVHGRGQRRRDRCRPHRAGLLVRQEQGGVAVRHRPGVRRQRHHDARLVLRTAAARSSTAN